MHTLLNIMMMPYQRGKNKKTCRYIYDYMFTASPVAILYYFRINLCSHEDYGFANSMNPCTYPQEFYLLFEELGLRLEDYIEISYPKSLYYTFFKDGTYYDFSTDLIKLNSY